MRRAPVEERHQLFILSRRSNFSIEVVYGGNEKFTAIVELDDNILVAGLVK